MPTKASDLRALVRESYDRIAERYLEWRAEQQREDGAMWISILSERLPPGSRVLIWAAAPEFLSGGLSQRILMLPVWISLLVRLSLRGATCLTHVHRRGCCHARLSAPELRRRRCVLFSVPHSAVEHEGLFRKLATWLRPGGFLLANFGIGNVDVDCEEDWLGAPMIWSSFDEDRARAVLKKAGFEFLIDRVEKVFEDGKPHKSLFVLLQR